MNRIGLIFLTITLTSCDSNTGNSALIGSWLTDACEQLNDSNSQPVNVWAKCTYTFDVKGSIYAEFVSYSDANCITKSNAIKTTSMLLAIFSEQGPVPTSQGISANKISITFSGAPPPAVTTSGYYKVARKQLCFSESFRFDAGGFGIGLVNDTDIDFINCLTKI